ncbi:MAG TPA: HYR domain-containing protein, partial [Planctomycetes bacterium]|nr:HYR domain-containing protein [Planctomycetota bacterium]
MWRRDPEQTLIRCVPGALSRIPPMIACITQSTSVKTTVKRNGNTMLKCFPLALAVVLTLALSASAQIVNVADINPGTFSSNSAFQFVEMGGEVFFAATDGVQGIELWKSDGTMAGTQLVKDINMGAGSSSPTELAAIGGLLYFQADDGVNGKELWVSDGTPAGTVLLKDINPTGDSAPTGMTAAGAGVVFAADDGVNGRELWITNGTTAGTTLFLDIFPGSLPIFGPFSSDPAEFTAVPNLGLVFFRATSDPEGAELWATDGFSAFLVLDIFPGISVLFSQPNSSSPSDLTAVGNYLFFTAKTEDDAVVAGGDKELWASDGTSFGTFRVQDINPGTGTSNPTGLVDVNGTLFLQADDGTNGAELWSSSDPFLGAQLVKDILAGPGGSQPLELTNADGTLFFRANDGLVGSELWKSDGTSSGTVLVADIRAGFAPSNPSGLFAASGSCAGVVFFAANDGVNGFELWASDGTAAGTHLIQDLRAGPASSAPQAIAQLGADDIIFQANDGTTGNEPYRAPIDNEAPVLTACPANITGVVTDPGICMATVSWTPPTATDNCPGVSLTSNFNPGDLFPVGTTTVTYTATDGSGNTASCSFTVMVSDGENPVITCPADIVMGNDGGACGASVTFSDATATDNCMGVVVARTDMTGLNSGDLFPVGDTVISFMATDASGNTASCSFTITVNDTENPVLLGCPTNMTVNNDPGACGATVSFAAPTATDNCPGVAVTQTAGPASGSLFPVGTTTVTFMAMDTATPANVASCSFDVVVTDNEAPVITCPGNISVNTDGGVCGATVTFAVTATDNCMAATVTQTDATGLSSGSVFPVGTTTLSFQADDGNGNTSSCSFDVTVTDNEAPNITCPANIAVNTDLGLCSAVVTFADATATDNCMVTSVVRTDVTGLNSGDAFPLGTTTIAYEATDSSGNVASCSFDIVVSDMEAPSITCPADVTVSTDAGLCSASGVMLGMATGSDPCSAVTITNDAPATFPLGNTTVTWTATDAASNSATCMQ